jgi:hypothetical protein
MQRHNSSTKGRNIQNVAYLSTLKSLAGADWPNWNWGKKMKTLEGTTRLAFLFFFGSHIPATLCIDLQALFPEIFPQILQDLLQWYTRLFNDSLMRGPYDAWFQAIVCSELLLQLPFFFVAVKVLLNTDNYCGRGWFRSACMVYGAHTSTTLIPIITCHCVNENATLLEKCMVISIYFPYLLFPLWLVYIGFVSEDVFGRTDSSNKKDWIRLCILR